MPALGLRELLAAISAMLPRNKENYMIGKLIGAMAGAKLSEHARSVNGPGGAMLGVAAVALARRMGPLGWIAAAAGGYALKRMGERQNRRAAQAPY
jgi:hypothetical protein